MKLIEIIAGVFIVLVFGYLATSLPKGWLIAHIVASVVILGVPVMSFIAGRLVKFNIGYKTPMKLFMAGACTLFAAFLLAVVASFAGADVTQPPLAFVFPALAFGGFALVCAALFASSSRRSRFNAMLITILALAIASPTFAGGGGGGGEADLGGCLILLLVLAVIIGLFILIGNKLGLFDAPKDRR